MKITIETGSQKTEICGGINAAEHVQDLAIDGVEQVQRAGFLRAVKSKTYPRGNTVTSVSFTITKEHADAQTAEAYLLTHHSAIPKTGSVIFTAEGNSEEQRTLSDASLERVNRRQIGVTTIVSYAFTGGDFT